MNKIISTLCLGVLCFVGMSFTHPGHGYEVGDKAADFKLKNIDGNFVSLADFKEAKGFIVVFTCNTCPYSVLYEDRLIELQEKHSAKGYQVVAINPNDPKIRPGDDFAAMKVRHEEKSFSFPYLFDEGQEVFPAFGATKTPHAYILDKELVVKYIGAIDDEAQDAEATTINYIDAAITALESGIDPNPNFTKAIGCGIKSDLLKKPGKPGKGKMKMKTKKK